VTTIYTHLSGRYYKSPILTNLVDFAINGDYKSPDTNYSRNHKKCASACQAVEAVRARPKCALRDP